MKNSLQFNYSQNKYAIDIVFYIYFINYTQFVLDINSIYVVNNNCVQVNVNKSFRSELFYCYRDSILLRCYD